MVSSRSRVVLAALFALGGIVVAEDSPAVRSAETQARDALDRLARDLAGFLPVASGVQALVFLDVPAGGVDAGDADGQKVADREFGARDAMMFWATSSYRDEVAGVHVTWLVDAADAQSDEGPRRMVLRRIARRAAGEAWADAPLVLNVCADVTSLNIEVFHDPDGDGRPKLPSFVQLGDAKASPYATRFDWWGQYPHPARGEEVPPSGPRAEPYCAGRVPDTCYPIGAPIDPPGSRAALPVPLAIRVTLRILAEGGRERLVSRVIWIPAE